MSVGVIFPVVVPPAEADCAALICQMEQKISEWQKDQIKPWMRPSAAHGTNLLGRL